MSAPPKITTESGPGAIRVIVSGPDTALNAGVIAALDDLVRGKGGRCDLPPASHHDGQTLSTLVRGLHGNEIKPLLPQASRTARLKAAKSTTGDA